MTHPAVTLTPASRHSWWVRAVRFPISRIVLAALAVFLPVLLLQAGLGLTKLSGTPFRCVSALMSAGVGLLGYSLYVRFVETRELAEFDSRGALKELGIGYLIGTSLFAATVMCLSLLGVFKLTGIGSWSAVAWPLASAIVAGVLEEVLFRGVLFRIIEESLGSWFALAVSAGIFGLVHLNSPSPTLLGVVSIMFEAGILLASAYMLTRRLWLPIGVHIAWNFTQGGVFGIAVSGTRSDGLLRGSLTGPEWLSGGTFGAEASVVAVSLCLTVAIAFLFLASRRGHFVRPRWSADKGKREVVPT